MSRLFYIAVIWTGMSTCVMAQYGAAPSGSPQYGRSQYGAELVPASYERLPAYGSPESTCGPPQQYPVASCNAPEPNYYYNPSCDAPQPTCAAPQPTCSAPQPTCGVPRKCNCTNCCPPQNPKNPPRAPQEQPPQGYFAAPPQNGTVAGGSNTVAVEGFALHFPSMTFKLPTLQLPTLTRMRTPPRMYVDQAQAPYVDYSAAPAAAPFAVQRTPNRAPINDVESNPPPKAPSNNCGAPAPNCAAPYPRCDAPSPNCTAELERRILQREQQMAQLERQIVRLGNTMERLIEQTNQVPRNQTMGIRPITYEERACMPTLLPISTPARTTAPAWADFDQCRRLPPVF